MKGRNSVVDSILKDAFESGVHDAVVGHVRSNKPAVLGTLKRLENKKWDKKFRKVVTHYYWKGFDKVKGATDESN